MCIFLWEFISGLNFQMDFCTFEILEFYWSFLHTRIYLFIFVSKISTFQKEVYIL